MDRTRQSARDGQLFSQVLLAPGTVFEGTVRNIPPHGRPRLAQALGSGILSFGRGRSAGWGRAGIDVEPAHRPRTIAERAADFDRALGSRLQEAGLTSDRVGRLVPVTLLSPLWPSGRDRDPPDPDDDGEHDLRTAVGAAGCFLAVRRFTRDGAWDQRTGKMTTFRATAAGGVFVLELAHATWRDVVSRLEALERDGVGQRRDQGFGQVLCFDPHFLPRPQNG
jgi:CRISPR-associated protein Csx10